MRQIRNNPQAFIDDGCWEWAHENDDENSEDKNVITDDEDSVFTMDKDAQDNEDLDDDVDDEDDDDMAEDDESGD